jgi:hypothetical protein
MAYPEFRQQLDSVLRTKNPEAVRQFLIAQGQWSEENQPDMERAMWMMIAGSPSLRDLHSEAQVWLVSHGYQNEAEVIRGQEKPSAKQRGASRKGQGRQSMRSSKPVPRSQAVSRRQNAGDNRN